MAWYDLGVRLVVAAVLAVAALGKLTAGRRVRAELGAGSLGRAAPLVMTLLPPAELVLAATLVTGAPYASLVAAAALFAGFLGHLLLDRRSGADSCACLGRREVPHRRMFALDLLVLAALAPALAAPELDRVRFGAGWLVPACLLVGLAVSVTRADRFRSAGRHTEGVPPVGPPSAGRRPAPPLPGLVPPTWVAFTAAGCGSCARVRPRLEAAGAVFVDVGERAEVADAWGVTHTPSVFHVAADGSTPVRPAIGEAAVDRLLTDVALSGSR